MTVYRCVCGPDAACCTYCLRCLWCEPDHYTCPADDEGEK